MSRPRSEIEMRASDLVRMTGTVAGKLRTLADNLDRVAEGFRKPNLRGGATGVAADIVNDYVQGFGPQGTFLWTIVRDAAELDHCRLEKAVADS